MNKPKFTLSDLQIGKASTLKKEQGILMHTHTVIFGRPLTQAERHLFGTLLNSFYVTVHFSRQFGNSLVGEPVVEFKSPNLVQYTLKNTTLSGEWKELLFAMLATFSAEVAPIHRHDYSRAFDPTRSQPSIAPLLQNSCPSCLS